MQACKIQTIMAAITERHEKANKRIAGSEFPVSSKSSKFDDIFDFCWELLDASEWEGNDVSFVIKFGSVE